MAATSAQHPGQVGDKAGAAQLRLLGAAADQVDLEDDALIAAILCHHRQRGEAPAAEDRRHLSQWRLRANCHQVTRHDLAAGDTVGLVPRRQQLSGRDQPGQILDADIRALAEDLQQARQLITGDAQPLQRARIGGALRTRLAGLAERIASPGQRSGQRRHRHQRERTKRDRRKNVEKAQFLRGLRCQHRRQRHRAARRVQRATQMHRHHRQRRGQHDPQLDHVQRQHQRNADQRGNRIADHGRPGLRQRAVRQRE